MKVAVAIITDSDNRVLITQRPAHASHGGLWEFPGGKLQPNESAEDALVREINEEVGLKIKKWQHLGDIKHQYPDKAIHLIVFLVTQFSGLPTCLEGQLDMQWVDVDNLQQSNFPAANHGIFKMLNSLLDR